jgi:hypothetical protein
LYPYDVKAHMQMVAERQAEIARDYERARKAQPVRPAAARERRQAIAPLLRALRRA